MEMLDIQECVKILFSVFCMLFSFSITLGKSYEVSHNHSLDRKIQKKVINFCLIYLFVKKYFMKLFRGLN